MNRNRTKNTLLMILTGLGSKLIELPLGFLTRTIFISTLGAEYLGINSVFTSLISMLSLADLGIASAISYYLYKPVAENNIPQIKSYMEFYKKSYRLIGVTILFFGLCLIPFMDKFINLNPNIEINIYLIFILFLLNSVFSYLFFAYRRIIISVNQKGYTLNLVNTIFYIINSLTTIYILLNYKNYVLCLIVNGTILIVQNICISILVGKVFPFINEKDFIPLDKEKKKIILVDVKSVAINKLSAILFNSTDNIIISVFIGTVFSGYNSNYLMIISSVLGIVSIVEASFVAGVGNITATSTKEVKLLFFKKFDFINFWIKSFCTVCFFQLLNPFITLWIGEDYLFSQGIVILICLNFLTQQLLCTIYTFRETMGLFRYGKYLQLIAGVANIFLSIILSKPLGVFGVFLATPICFVSVFAITFIKIDFIYGFEMSPIKHILKYFYYIFITVISCSAVFFICLIFKELNWVTFIGQMAVCVVVPNLIIYLFFRKSQEFAYTKEKSLSILKSLKTRLSTT